MILRSSSVQDPTEYSDGQRQDFELGIVKIRKSRTSGKQEDFKGHFYITKDLPYQMHKIPVSTIESHRGTDLSPTSSY